MTTKPRSRVPATLAFLLIGGGVTACGNTQTYAPGSTPAEPPAQQLLLTGSPTGPAAEVAFTGDLEPMDDGFGLVKTFEFYLDEPRDLTFEKRMGSAVCAGEFLDRTDFSLENDSFSSAESGFTPAERHYDLGTLDAGHHRFRLHFAGSSPCSLALDFALASPS